MGGTEIVALAFTPRAKRAVHGTIWFVGSRGDGPDAEDEEDRSAAAHSGQIWKYDPVTQTLKLKLPDPE